MVLKILVLCSVFTILTGQAGLAQDQADGKPQNAGSETSQDRQDASAEDGEDKSESRVLLRASRLRESAVYGPDREKLGSTVELAIDMRPGRVRYAVLSYGDFMGIGEKLFAVPYGAFHYSHDEHGIWLRLNVEKQQLRDAPGFDRKAWPGFADDYWRSAVESHYKDALTSQKADQSESFQNAPDTAGNSEQKREPAYKLGGILGTTIRTQSGGDAGKLSDLLVDAKNGRIVSAIISTGGMLGLGDSPVRVPLDCLSLHRSQNEDSEYWFVYSPEKPEK